uniref:FYVE-type domain-containing protein n=1 Tax=Glossina brevipalpis TaxID=37001 RepID=A0A1A9X3W2_9MUSC
MDLVDIDQVLDNLELNEEAANERQKAEEQLVKELARTSTNGVVALPNISTLNKKALVVDKEQGLTSLSNITVQTRKAFEERDELDNAGFQPSRSRLLLATCKQELVEYENEVEQSHDIQKFTEKEKKKSSNSQNLIDNNSSNSSESLTTSSPSTFSSGPSLGEDTTPEDVESKEEDSPQRVNNKCLEKPAITTQTETLEDLAQGLSSISINTSANLQTQSILPLETTVSSSIGRALENLSETSVSNSVLSQIRDDLELSKKPNSLEEKEKAQAKSAENSIEIIPSKPLAYNVVPFKEQQTSHLQPVTFCSTMDDISDTELDSMLQEMDIDDDMDNSLTKPATINVKEQREQILGATSVVQACNEESESSTSDHPNGDSFSQASTVEFSEIRAPARSLETNSVASSYTTTSSSGSNSESSSLDGDIIHTKTPPDRNDDINAEAIEKDNQEKEEEGEDNDSCRPQRPTTLDIPALQSLDLYSNAGQTPPGNDKQINELDQSPQSPTAEEQIETAATTQNLLRNDVAEATGYSEDPHSNVGKIPPIWVPDNMATGCMNCSAKFTMIKRRHHCRACGKVLCSVCCSQKYKLEFLVEPESRVCVQCYLILIQRHDDSVPRAEDGEDLHTKTLAKTPSGSTATCSSPPVTRSPNPNNPMEYCSTIPPHKQVSGEPKDPPSVIVPVGVLKKDNAGSNSSNSSNSSGQKARKRKSVMFSDGIAPGSDLAIIDQWNEPKQPRRQSERNHPRQSNNNNIKPPTPGGRTEQITDASSLGLMAQLFRGSIPPIIAANTLNAVQQSTGNKGKQAANVNKATSESTSIAASITGKSNDVNRSKSRLPPSGCDEHGCFIPIESDHSLPPIILFRDESGCDFDYKDVINNYELLLRLQKETLKFAVQKNFFVYVKIVNLKCCLNRTVINFTTDGMHHVGNDEIIILLECDIPANKEELHSPPIPKDVFMHLNEIYNNADKGNRIAELSHTSPATNTFLGSRNYGGFIYIRPTFQCMQDVIIPENPYLIGILIHRYEVPWAKVFPLRLMLRLGAQYRYYPCPHISMCNRESVYAEIAQTIINFLADFRNYSYTLPFIHGMYIHMEDRQTTVVIPRNRLEDVVKAINNSSDHILAFGGNFSKAADGHLVCMQNLHDDNSEMYAYSTQAINIQGQPRKVTGASFFVLNESLKTSSGLSGKCSIVEDGLMVQILPAKMEEIRNALKNQNDVTIVCGPVNADEQQTEIVCLKWVDNDKEVNIGVKSPIDGRLMDGISSMRVHASFNYSNTNYAIRLTDIYVLKYDEWYASASTLTPTTLEITLMTEQIARSTSIALVPFLDLLTASKHTKIGLRFTLHQDSVCYEAGAGGSKLPPLYMNALDNHLIPTLHSISSNIEDAIILELIFYILNV